MVFEDLVGIILCTPWVTPTWQQQIVVDVVIFVVAMLIAPWLVRWRVGKLRRLLAYDRQASRRETDESSWVDLSSDEVDERLASLGLEDENTAKTLLNVGFGNGCDLAIDFTLIHFVMRQKISADMLVFCARWLICFPCENTSMGAVLRRLQFSRGMGFDARFLVFQIEQIRVIRQSTNSQGATEKLLIAMELSRNAQAVAREAWEREVVYYPRFRNLSSVVRMATSRCGEIASSFPASTSHGQVHLRALVDAAADYRGGVLVQERLDDIEVGHIRVDDSCYRALLARYPFYLKGRILGFHGEALGDLRVRGSSSSRVDSSTPASGASGGMDVGVEEAIARRVFTHARTRLAMQTSLDSLKMASSTSWALYRGFAPVISIAVAVALYVGFSHTFDGHSPRFQRQSALTEAQRGLGLAWLMLIMDQSDATGRLRFDALEPLAALFDETEPVIPFIGSEYGDNSQLSAFGGAAAMSTFFEMTAEFVSDGEDTRAAAPSVFTSALAFNPCSAGKPLDKRTLSLPSLFSHVFQNLILLREREIGQWWSHAPWAEVPVQHDVTNVFCTVANSWSSFSEAVSYLKSAMSDELERAGVSEARTLRVMLVAIPIGFGVLLFVPFGISVAHVLRGLQRFAFLISKTPKSFKAQCAEALVVGSDRVDFVPRFGDGAAPKHDAMMLTLIAATCVMFAGEVALTVVLFMTMRDTNVKLRGVNRQLERAHQIGPVSVDLVRVVVAVMLLQDREPGNLVTSSQKGRRYGAPNATLATSTEVELARIDKLLWLLDLYVEGLAGDLDDFVSIFEADDLAGDLLRGSTCESDERDYASLHGIYRCASLMVSLRARSEFVVELKARIGDGSGDVADSLSTNLLDQLSYHLLPALDAMVDRLGVSLPEDLVKSFQTRSLAFMLGGIALALAAQAMMMIWTSEAEQVYEGLMMAVRRLPPQVLVEYQPLLDFLLQRESSGRSMTFAHSAVHNWPTPLVVVNHQGVIQLVSRAAVQRVFGYGVEQLLGQQATMLFASSGAVKIEARPRFERMECVGANGERFPASVAMMEIRTGTHCDLLVIMRDLRQIEETKLAADVIRETTDELLKQIIPNPMLIESDPIVKTEIASFGFVDVTQFSEWSALLTPQEVVTVLSALFAGYDRLLADLDAVTRVSTVGDSYLVAGGLFGTSSSHAEQTLRFCVQAVFEVLEAVNSKFDFAPHALRAGVHTGGPVLCAVMGGERPSFDVFGTPIAIASRLQETCPAGKVALSAGTYAFVDRRMPGLAIEPRGEVFFEGIGSRQTWVAAPRVGMFTGAATLAGAQEHVSKFDD